MDEATPWPSPPAGDAEEPVALDQFFNVDAIYSKQLVTFCVAGVDVCFEVGVSSVNMILPFKIVVESPLPLVAMLTRA